MTHIDNIVVHYDQRWQKYKYFHNAMPSPTKLTKGHVSAAVNHYQRVMDTGQFARLTSAQQKSVVCLRRKWETLQYAHRTRQS